MYEETVIIKNFILQRMLVNGYKPSVIISAFWLFGVQIVNFVVFVSWAQSLLAIVIEIVSVAKVFIRVDFVAVLVVDYPGQPLNPIELKSFNQKSSRFILPIVFLCRRTFPQDSESGTEHTVPKD